MNSGKCKYCSQMNQAILQRSCSLPLIIFRGSSISLYTAVFYLINGVLYVYCKVVLSLISTLLSIISFQNLKTPHLKFLSHVLSCVTLITFMLFPFLFCPYIYTYIHTVLIFIFQLYFNWDVSFESLCLFVLHCLAHNIQQRNQSHQFSSL